MRRPFRTAPRFLNRPCSCRRLHVVRIETEVSTNAVLVLPRRQRMRFFLHGKFVLVMATCCLCVASDSPAAEKFDAEKLLADFRIARQALEEGHSGIYRYTSKKELDRIFDQADKSLTRPMSVIAFYRV